MKMYADIVQEKLDKLGDKGDSDLLSKLNAQIDRLTWLDEVASWTRPEYRKAN